jgi:uncharacterized membrane protein YhaH (DUF805 family)
LPHCKKKLNPDTVAGRFSRAAFFTVLLWVLILVIMPLYVVLISIGFSKPLRYGVSALCAAGGLGGAFALGNKIRRKEVFMLFAVFETVLFILNAVPAAAALAANPGKDASPTGTSFTVDVETPSPNVYWLFMDGMLGFEGMERLFGDRQEAFAAALEGQGFRINRNAQFEVFHATQRATAALMSPAWYDREFLPLLRTVNLENYHDKEKKLGKVNPLAARRNNELLRTFRAKGYTVYTISDWGLYLHTSFSEIADTIFYENKMFRNPDRKFLDVYLQFYNLNNLLTSALAPWPLIDGLIVKAGNLLCENRLNSEDVPRTVSNRTAVYGGTYDGADQWYVDALLKTFTEAGPRLTIIHDAKAHCPFIRNEDGSLEAWIKTDSFDPANYPPQHRYAAKIALAYIALILEHDPDAVIVVQADHGLHHPRNREILLEKGGTEEDVRIMQNQVMSAVRIPETWGGLEEPLDPLDISRELVNRFVGKNYSPVAAHP